MEIISSTLIIYISEFLDIHSLLSLRSVSRGMLSSLNKYFQVHLNRKPSAIIRPDALFDYNYEIFARDLSLRTDFLDAGKVYVDMLHCLRHPIRCILIGIENSSYDNDQDIHKTYQYLDGRFWSSKGSLTPEENEFLIFELKTLCAIFEVQYRNYRAFYEGGILYPSKFMQIKVGLEMNSWSYESEILPVELTEELQHVFLLPNIVIGKYVKIELIGKVNTKFHDKKYYSMLDFVDILGFPTNNLRYKELLPSLKDFLPEISSELEEEAVELENMESIPPFEVMKHLDDQFLTKLKDEIELDHTLMYGNKYLNDICVLYMFKSKLIDCESALIRYSRFEIVADELYKCGLYAHACDVYSESRNGPKLIKGLLTIRKYEYIISNLLIDIPMLPKLPEIKHIALSLGAEIYEGFIEALTSHGRIEDS